MIHRDEIKNVLYYQHDPNSGSGTIGIFCMYYKPLHKAILYGFSRA